MEIDDAKIRISELVKSVAKLRKEDISYNEHGSANGFREAQETKGRICDWLDEQLGRTSNYIAQLNSATLEAGLNHIEKIVTQSTATSAAIDALVAKGVHQSDYPQQRVAQIGKFQNLEASAHTGLELLNISLSLIELEATVDTGAVTTARREFEAAAKEAKSSSDEIKKILASVQRKIGTTTAETAGQGFTRLRDLHKTREFRWFVGMCIFSLVTVIAIYFSVAVDVDTTNLQSTIFGLFRRVLYISTPAVFMKLCLSKYNLERNLRIIYDHRHTVLDQYLVFENAIPETDSDGKGKLRLEMARVIFSDPHTGYAQTNSASELNINPVVNTIEKVASRDGT